MAFPIYPVLGAVAGVGFTIAAAERLERARERGTLIGASKRKAKIKMESKPVDIDYGEVFQARPVPREVSLSAIVAEPVPGEEESDLVIWGPGGAWQAAYLKSEGCKDLRWGVCFQQWVDTLENDPGYPAWAKDKEQLIYRIANIVAAGTGSAAEWIVDRLCLRFKWPLKAYRSSDAPSSPFAEPNERLWAVRRGEAGILMSTAPMHPFPARDGYSRVWVSSVQQPMTRNETARTVYWPGEEGGAGQLAELVSTEQIRGMLRMDLDYTGAITSSQLAGAQCDRSSWWFARKSKAEPEYK